MRRCPDAPPLPTSMEYGKSRGRVSPRIRGAGSAMLKAQTQNLVQVRTGRHGLVVIQRNTRMYESRELLVANGIVQVDPGSPFWILVSNFTDNDYQILKIQVVVTALPHPTVVVPTHISTADVLGLTHVGDTDEELQTPSGDQLQTAKDPESLVDDLDLAHVSEHYRTKIRSMLKKYTSMWSGKLGEISATEHHIDLVPGSRPISQPPYRAGPRTRQIEEENVSKMLEEGLIKAAQSAWASPVVLGPKPDGSLRFCIDYRKLNAVTVRDTYPLPRMDEFVDSLGEANVFTTLDANSGYWQFAGTVQYLGHVIKPGQHAIQEAQTAALREVQPPSTQKQLRSFLGLCNVYRRFVPQYSHIAAPLNSKLRKGQPVQLDQFRQAEVEAFDTPKTKIITAPVLALPIPNLPYSVDTDSSEYQVGCALFQTHPDGERKPIGYWSRSLNAAEKKYSVSEKECLAVVWALTTLRPYLQGERFTVNTDHSSLRWLLSITDPSGRLTRWRLRLSEFDFEVKYKKGLADVQADALSRLKTLGETQGEIDEEIPCFYTETHSPPFEEEEQKTLDDYLDADPFLALADTEPSVQLERILCTELLNEQQADAFCASIRSRLNGGEELHFSLDSRRIMLRHVEKHDQIVIPHVFKSRIHHPAHYSRLSGHLGRTKLFMTLRRYFYWRTLAMDCHATVSLCTACAKNRVRLYRKRKSMTLFQAKAPLQYVSIDILGELIRSRRGYRYLLVITDRFSKLVRTVPLKRITAAVITQAFIKLWVFIYGPPKVLLSDNGKQFVAKFFQNVCRIMGIRNVFTTTYHPQCNGHVERFNRTLIAALRHSIEDHPKEWDKFTDTLCYAYNTQMHSSIKTAPFDLVLSRNPPALAVLLDDKTGLDAPTPAKYHLKWRNDLKPRAEEAAKELSKTQARYKRNYDARRRRRNTPVRVGGHVFVRVERPDKQEESPHKLLPIAAGPFKVVDLNEDTVVIKTGEDVERVSGDGV
ncbi:unnamed protein product [Agarophyton chilense]